jgi:hypothetical protein
MAKQKRVHFSPQVTQLLRDVIGRNAFDAVVHANGMTTAQVIETMASDMKVVEMEVPDAPAPAAAIPPAVPPNRAARRATKKR